MAVAQVNTCTYRFGSVRSAGSARDCEWPITTTYSQQYMFKILKDNPYNHRTSGKHQSRFEWDHSLNLKNTVKCWQLLAFGIPLRKQQTERNAWRRMSSSILNLKFRCMPDNMELLRNSARCSTRHSLLRSECRAGCLFRSKLCLLKFISKLNVNLRCQCQLHTLTCICFCVWCGASSTVFQLYQDDLLH